MTSLNPTWTIGRQIAEAVRLHRDVHAGGGAGARARGARARRYAAARRAARRVPAPAVRRPAPARDDRDGAACSPKLLIADEPTTALDVTIQAQILDLIDGLRRDLKMAVILITHDLGVIAARANRVMVMYAGKIAEGADTEELFAAMRHPYTRGAVPVDPAPRPGPLAGAVLDPRRAARSVRGPRRLPVRAALPLRARALPARGAAARARDGDGSSPAPGRSTPRRQRCSGRSRREHVFACFHPVDGARPTTTAPRSSSSRSRAPEPRALEPAASARCCSQIDQLVKEFPVTSGAVMQRKVGTRQGGLRRLVRRPPRRDVRPRRRVGLREDDDRLADRRAPPADVGIDPLRRPGHGDAARARRCATRGATCS